MDAIDYTLYLVTDRKLMSSKNLEQCVDKACKGGVTLVQLREKHSSYDEFLKLAKSIKKITDSYGVGLIINDEPQIAASIEAAGVHVGQNDMPVSDVRKIVGPNTIIGVSASTLDEAKQAQVDGADYLGIGAMHFTPTKPEAHTTTKKELAQILDSVQIPCVLIGGMNKESILEFADFDVGGYAVVSAIVAAQNIEKAAKELREAISHVRSK